MRDLTVRGRCFLAAGAAAVICGVQIGERDFVRIGLVAALVPILAWLLLRRTQREVWMRRNVSDLQVEAGDIAQVEVQVGNPGRRTGMLLMEEELPAGARASTSGSSSIPSSPAGRPRCGTRSGPSTGGATRWDRCTCGWPIRMGMVDLDQTMPTTASILVTPRTEPLPQIPLTGRWAGAGDNRTRDLLGGGSPDVTDPGVPPRRRPAPHPLAEQRPRRRADGAARGAAVAVALHAADRQPPQLPPRLRRQLLDGDRGAVPPPRSCATWSPSTSRSGWSARPDGRPPTAGTRAPAGVTLPEQLERLALMGMTRNEQLSTAWVDESSQGGMLLAVLGHLGEADRAFFAGLANAGDSAYAVVLDVSSWDRSRCRASHRPPRPCAAAAGRRPRSSATAARRCLAGARPMTTSATSSPGRSRTPSARRR